MPPPEAIVLLPCIDGQGHSFTRLAYNIRTAAVCAIIMPVSWSVLINAVGLLGLPSSPVNGTACELIIHDQPVSRVAGSQRDHIAHRHVRGVRPRAILVLIAESP